MRSQAKALRLLVAVLAVVALAFVVAACGGDDDDEPAASATATTSGETQEVEMLLSFPKAILWLPLLVAEDQGYFEEQGLTVTTQTTDGSEFVTQQIIAGNADFGWAGAAADVLAFAKVPDLRALACNNAKNIFSIQVPEDSDIQDVSDLSGKTLGITTKGSGEGPLVDSVLKENDLTDTVTVLPLGEAGPAVVRALETGQVDAFAGGVTDFVTLEAGGLQMRDITPSEYAPMPGDCLITTADVLAEPEGHDAAVGILRAWAKGAFFGLANEKAALDIACKEVPEGCTDRENFAQPLLDLTVSLLQPVDESLPPTGLDPAGWEVTAEVLAASGALEDQVDVSSLVESEDVVAVKEEAYSDIDQLQQQAEQDAADYQGG